MLIYKATFPNGKSYIGLTRKSLEIRKSQHRKFISHKKSKRLIFYIAIRKYGWENVKWEILEDNINDFKYLKEREIFNILKHDSFIPNGYNMTLGGEGSYGCKVSDEHKEKLRRIFKGIPLTRETKELMSKNHADFEGDKNPFYKKHHTEETKIILKEKNSGKNAYNYGRKFTQEHIDKIKKHHIGRKRSEETKRKIREARIEYYKRIKSINTNKEEI